MKKIGSFKNFSYVAAARMISAGLQGIFYLMFANLLEPELYGEMSYIIAIAGTASIISRFGLSHSVTVYHGKGNQLLVNQINTLAAITTTAAALILLLINEFAALLAFGLSFFIMSQFNLLGTKEYKKHMLLAITRSALILIIPISLYFVLEIPGVLLGMAISSLVCSFDFIKYLKHGLRSFSKIRGSYKVLIHNFGVDASSNLPRVIDKIVVVPLYGFALVGIYQLNVQILFALEMLPLALHGYLLSEESSGKSHHKVMVLLLAFSVVLVVIVIVISPWAINQFFPKYTDGIFSLQLMITSLIPLTIAAIFNAKLQAKESTKIGYSAIIRVGSLLILLAILGEIFGLVGLALAVLLSIIFYTGFLGILYIKTRN